jgi:hypothetical protein
MTEQNNTQVSIIPKSDEAREKFYARCNEWIGLQYQIESAQEAQKELMNLIADDFVEANPDVKKGDVKKRTGLMIKEFLEGKATAEAQLCDDVLGDYSIAQKFLKG